MGLTGSPLEEDRRAASFSLEEMKGQIDSPAVREYRNSIYQFMQQTPCFKRLPADSSLDDQRFATYQRTVALLRSGLLGKQTYLLDLRKLQAFTICVGDFDWSLMARLNLLLWFCQNAILVLGTERHYPLLEKLQNMEMGGTFCLTEISHGSNARGLRTEARYDLDTRSFVLNTPDFAAAKCWAGNLGETASHGFVFAQLYTPDRTCHGLHCFVVPLRDPATMETLPGVTIADMGHKLGLNGVDNGVLLLRDVLVPRENLLNRIGDVTPDGHYVSPYPDSNKRLAASLGPLSFGRIGIIGNAANDIKKAMTIAVRYSAVRRQFGPGGSDVELPVLDYPLHQWRLLRYVASAYLLDHFSKKFTETLVDFRKMMFENHQDSSHMARLGQEMHALSSAGKPVATWLSRDSIQEGREACGGHGYLKASGFGELRDDNDAMLTYEGDNNVLLNQAASWVLRQWRMMNSSQPPTAQQPLGTTLYLASTEGSVDVTDEMTDAEVGRYCVDRLQAAVRELCKATTADKVALTRAGYDSFAVNNSTQVYRAHTLAKAYFHVVVLSWYQGALSSCPPNLLPVLTRLWALYGATNLLHTSRAGNNAGVTTPVLERHVMRLCGELRRDAVTLVDAFAPPDFCLNSVLGREDGRVYEHLEAAMFDGPAATDRRPYWHLMTYPPPPAAKL